MTITVMEPMQCVILTPLLLIHVAFANTAPQETRHVATMIPQQSVQQPIFALMMTFVMGICVMEREVVVYPMDVMTVVTRTVII